MVYSEGALAKSSAGIRNPSTERIKALTQSAFLSPKVYGGLYREARVANRSSVPVFLALYSLPPSCLETNGGSFQNITEDTTMSNDIYDIPLRLSASQMDAFQILLLNLLECDLSGFTDGNDLLAMHAKIAAEKAINAMSIYGDVQ